MSDIKSFAGVLLVSIPLEGEDSSDYMKIERIGNNHYRISSCLNGNETIPLLIDRRETIKIWRLLPDDPIRWHDCGFEMTITKVKKKTGSFLSFYFVGFYTAQIRTWHFMQALKMLKTAPWELK
jgi:hypothetical protein